jgi:hypothetical protein
VISGLIGILGGCGGSSTRTYDDGRLYVVNNLSWGQHLGPLSSSKVDERYILVEWEGEVRIHPNMDQEGNPTGIGAVQLTPESLPGGTEIDFPFTYAIYWGKQSKNELSVLLEALGFKAIIDGDITIEIYSQDWTPASSSEMVCLAAVLRGKRDEIHVY